VLSVELHTHSALSHDGRDPVDLLLSQAAAVGLDALAVTDHDEIDASLEAVEKAPAFGIDELVPAGLSFDDTLDHIRAQGGIAVVPHPFQKSRHGVAHEITRDQLASADAIEVYNSRLLTGRANRQAERFAERRGLPMVAGSDAHIGEMVGQAVTHVDADERSVDAILEAIADGRTSVEGKRTPWTISFRQAAGGAKRRIRHGLSDLL
jgi:hypothetical protein